ncbi:MAG TPA: DNA topoisomerase IB [Beutenbergiaceae bacterium]|nr:DNA topoisomerase IB [Beutenbergiaceae bacterium]
MKVRRSDPAEPGFHRLPGENGFRYIDPRGDEVENAEWIEDLVIPPAWQDVWICPDPCGHIQATGRDAAGRLQYLYHPAWREAQDALKFERALHLAETLAPARASVTRDLAEPEPTHRRALATAFRLIDTLAIRIGSEAYLDAHGTRGLCTLLCRHARVDGDTLTLNFPAKSGISWEASTHDAAVSRIIRGTLARRGPRARLLCWHTASERPGRGRWRVLTPEEVNTDIHERTGGDFTAKDFRTLHGSAAAAEYLAHEGSRASETERTQVITAAVKHVAEVLGNTPAVTRESYIDPRILERYQAGEEFPRTSRTPESALLHLLHSSG